MKTMHLVESHLGGLYISSAPASSITAYCDQCGDCDIIVASWHEDDVKAEAEAIANYFADNGQFAENPWEALMDSMFETMDQCKAYLIEAIDDFEDFSSDEARELARIVAEKRIRELSDKYAAWGVAPVDEDVLTKSLVDSANEYFYSRTLGHSAEQVFGAEDYMPYRLPREELWGCNLEGHERAFVRAMDILFPGYRKLYEQHYDWKLFS